MLGTILGRRLETGNRPPDSSCVVAGCAPKNQRWWLTEDFAELDIQADDLWHCRFEPQGDGPIRVTEAYEVRWIPAWVRILDVPTNRHKQLLTGMRTTLECLRVTAEVDHHSAGGQPVPHEEPRCGCAAGHRGRARWSWPGSSASFSVGQMSRWSLMASATSPSVRGTA